MKQQILQIQIVIDLNNEIKEDPICVLVTEDLKKLETIKIIDEELIVSIRDAIPKLRKRIYGINKNSST